MSTAWRALRDEAETLARDPGALLILVVAVIVYGLIYPVPYSAAVVREVPVLVVDEDRSPLSRQLARMLDAHAAVRVTGIVEDPGAAERALAAGTVRGALLVPTGFARHVSRGETAEVVAIADATYFLLYKAALTGMAETVGTLSAGIEIRRLEARGTPGWLAASARAPLRIDARPLFNPGESYAAYVVPAVYLVILHQTLLIGIGLVQGTRRERVRRAGSTQRRLGLADGLSTLAGRTTVYLAIYAVHAAVYFGVLLPWLGLPPQADGLTLVWFLLPFLLATTWLGIVLGGIFRTRESAMATIFVISSLVVFSIGFAWPRESMASWVGLLVAWLPADRAVTGLLRLAQMGASPDEVRAQWEWLWLLATVYFGLAWLTEAVAAREIDSRIGTSAGLTDAGAEKPDERRRLAPRRWPLWWARWRRAVWPTKAWRRARRR